MFAIGGEPISDAENQGLSQDERAELERLRAKTAELQSQGPAHRRRFSWRPSSAVVLIVLGCVLGSGRRARRLGRQRGFRHRPVGGDRGAADPRPGDPERPDRQDHHQITSQLNITGTINQAATQLNSRGLPRISSLLNTFGPQIASAVTGFIHSTVHTVISSQAMATSGCRSIPCAPGGGQGALRAGQRRHQHEQRPDHAQPRPVHRRGQAGPARARVLAGEQHPAGQPDRGAVPGQGPRQGAGRLPADQDPQDRAAHPGAGLARRRGVRRAGPPARPDRSRPSAWPRPCWSWPSAC